MADPNRFYEAPVAGLRRSAPAALRNREPIREVLADWLPATGVVLEIASGTGEHAVFLAEHFPGLEWQPSDLDPGARQSIASWREASRLPNLHAPVELDASSNSWPVAVEHALQGDGMREQSIAAILCINMVHISPQSASLGLLKGSAKVLETGGALILYGPWVRAGVPTAPTNLAFDEDLRRRNPEWGLRKVEDFEAQAQEQGFVLEELRAMPANNLMLLFRFRG